MPRMFEPVAVAPALRPSASASASARAVPAAEWEERVAYLRAGDKGKASPCRSGRVEETAAVGGTYSEAKALVGRW